MTLEIGWKLFSLLPKEELTRLSQAELDQYYEKADGTS
jgi:vacuolar-type H+-ATPase subunit B/Vma2